MSELKPCPFCGSEDYYIAVTDNPFSYDTYSTTHCSKCHATGPFVAESYLEDEPKPTRDYMEAVAKEKWQTRPIEDDLRKRIAELTECVGSKMADVYTLKARIAELEAESERFTVHSDIERQDDKSPNDTQTSTIVYGKWIPVGERLPECEKDVLVFWGKASDGSKIDWFGTAWRNECDDGKWCTDPIVPTHWMPLPEPPIVYGKVCEE